jgi:hypothetical protein
MGSINFWMVRLSKTTVFERIMYNFGGDFDFLDRKCAVRCFLFYCFCILQIGVYSQTYKIQ